VRQRVNRSTDLYKGTLSKGEHYAIQPRIAGCRCFRYKSPDILLIARNNKPKSSLWSQRWYY